MPIYEFECEECHHRFEVVHLQTSENKEENSCPACKSTSVRKCISKVSFQLKGGGYYSKD